MSTIIQDIMIVVSKLKYIFKIFKVFTWLLSKLKFGKKTTDLIQTPVAVVQKVSLISKIKNIITPRAKLTYWLADEEVIVYITNFKQKDKCKLLYTELETGKAVMVNSSAPINYRLEEVKAGDPVEKKEVQQNQRY
jgi:hypothetical protein